MTEAQHGCTAPGPSSFQQTSWNSWSWPLEWKVILGFFCLGVIRQRHHQSWAGELQWVTIGDKIMSGATATWWGTARVPVLITRQRLDFVVNGWGHWLCNSKMKKGVFFSNCVRPMKLKLKYLFIFNFCFQTDMWYIHIMHEMAIMQFLKGFSRLWDHCVAGRLKLQNQWSWIKLDEYY